MSERQVEGTMLKYLCHPLLPFRNGDQATILQAFVHCELQHLPTSPGLLRGRLRTAGGTRAGLGFKVGNYGRSPSRTGQPTRSHFPCLPRALHLKTGFTPSGYHRQYHGRKTIFQTHYVPTAFLPIQECFPNLPKSLFHNF